MASAVKRHRSPALHSRIRVAIGGSNLAMTHFGCCGGHSGTNRLRCAASLFHQGATRVRRVLAGRRDALPRGGMCGSSVSRPDRVGWRRAARCSASGEWVSCGVARAWSRRPPEQQGEGSAGRGHSPERWGRGERACVRRRNGMTRFARAAAFLDEVNQTEGHAANGGVR